MNLPFSPDIFPDLDRHPAYVVGGAVRDLLMGKVPLDYDIAVVKECEALAQRTAANISGRMVKLGKPGQTIYRIVTREYVLDLAAVAGQTIEDDLRQRDFTVNALAYELKSGQFIDCFSGRQDLEGAVIRMVTGTVFKKDPVRLIRAYRLAVELGFEIAPATKAQILQDARLVSRSAGERVRDEFFKILNCALSYPAILGMAHSTLLYAVLPELEELKQCRSNDFHAFDAHEHTLSAYAHLENILNHVDAYMPQGVLARQNLLSAGLQSLLKFAILMHDIGKNRVKSVDGQGRTHYYGHPNHSARMFQAVRRRLKLSNRDADYIEFIVRNHLRPLFLFTAQRQGAPARPTRNKARTRFFIKCGRRTPDLLLHALADMRAKVKMQDRRCREFDDFVKGLMQAFFERHRPLLAVPPLLSGHDLKNTFGLEPSPLFKTILNRVEAERLAGTLRSKTEAEKWVANYLARLKTKKPL